MLRFQRVLHTSRVCLQEIPASIAKEQINAYLTYFKTPKDLRPLVYRKRNASELLSRDLWDPVAKKRVVPLDPPKRPSGEALSQLFRETESVDELFELRGLMLQLANKPKYTTSHHVNGFLEKSAELRKFPHAITYIYTQKKLDHVIDSDVTNTILTFLYINPRKALQDAITKTNTAVRFTKHKDQITDLLRASIYHKHGAQIPSELREKITSAESVTLPVLKTDKPTEELVKKLEQERYTYLQLSPIVKELAEEPLIKDIDTLSVAKDFVAKYQEIQKKVGVEDAFEAVVAKSLFGKPEPATEEAAEEAETQE